MCASWRFEVRIWRIEGPDGLGPFTGGPKGSELSWLRAAKLPDAVDTALHDPPGPCCDGRGLQIDESRRCGFATAMQLNRWFPKDVRAYFRGLPIALAEYDVPEASVDIGCWQVTFCIADAQIQHAQSLADAVIFD
jgi:hypothetical protein